MCKIFLFVHKVQKVFLLLCNCEENDKCTNFCTTAVLYSSGIFSCPVFEKTP